MRSGCLLASLYMGVLMFGCGDEPEEEAHHPLIGTWKGNGKVYWGETGHMYFSEINTVGLTFSTLSYGYKATFSGKVKYYPPGQPKDIPVNVELVESGTIQLQPHKTESNILFSGENHVVKYDRGVPKYGRIISGIWTYSITGTSLSLKRSMLGGENVMMLGKQ